MENFDMDGEYYAHAGKIPLASKISKLARRNISNYFLENMKVCANDLVLDVGVSLDVQSEESNYLEKIYLFPDQLVCAGIGSGESFNSAFPNIKFVEITPGAPLPFTDKSFDIVYSNAVLEHVGSNEQQKQFILELLRVAKSVFIVVPNRLFPVEPHTGIPFLHYLPSAVFRKLLRHTRFSHWSYEENLNLLYSSDIENILATMPHGDRFSIVRQGLPLGYFSSNIIFFTPR